MRCLIFKNRKSCELAYRREETSTETPTCAITVMKVNPACEASSCTVPLPAKALITTSQTLSNRPPPPPAYSVRKPELKGIDRSFELRGEIMLI